jgi:5-methylcytosine-specific restriction endonuclease McrA
MYLIDCRICYVSAKKYLDGGAFPDLCTKCAHNERVKLKYRENPAKSVARVMAWQAKNREKINSKANAYYRENVEYLLARKKEIYNSDPERYRSYSRTWKELHPEKVKAKEKLWSQNNPEKLQTKKHKRRALKKSSLGSFTSDQWKKLVQSHNGRCIDCNASGVMTVGHLVPLSKGGSNWIGNIKPQCVSCNSKQGSKVHPKAVLSLFDKVEGKL